MDTAGNLLLIALLMLIPMIAIIGGIVHGIVRTVGRQRLMELARKERIAAIERGVDPKDLPPASLPGESSGDRELTFEQSQLRLSQGLKIAGLITVAAGLGLGVPLIMLGEPEGWIPGTIMLAIGIALLLSAQITRPTNHRNGRGSSGDRPLG